MTVTDRSAPRRTTALPRGVWSMAFTELWERFSFYGLQGILSFYLLYELSEGGLALDPVVASAVVGAYGGSVYLAQLVGAWLGDRLVAPARMVLAGGVVIMAGHVVLAVVPGLTGLAVGLVLIVIGTGALKTNITSIVGFVLDQDEPERRDVGFSYFYMAINVGAVVGPLSTGFVQDQAGFHWGFGLAAVGMALALVQYVATMGGLPEPARRVQNPLPRERRTRPLLAAGAGVALLVLSVVAGVVTSRNLATVVTVLALVVAAAYFVTMLRSPVVTPAERRRVAGYVPVFLVAGVYFGLLFQKFTAISILITERIDLTLGERSFPVAWVTATSPLAAVLVTPLVARLWARLGERQPGPVTKTAIGLVQIGLAYVFLLLVASGEGTIPLGLVLLFMALAGSSEVFVGPIGLSLASRIGPASFRAQMVGLNFLTLALGSSLSGLLGQYFTVVSNPTYFTTVAVTGIVLGVVLLAVRRPVDRALFAGLSDRGAPAQPNG